MIKPTDCGPIPDRYQKISDKAELEIDRKLRNDYDPESNNPLDIFNEVNDLRVCSYYRAFKELIAKYEINGWSCVWIPNSTDGMATPYLVAKGFEPKDATRPLSAHHPC